MASVELFLEGDVSLPYASFTAAQARSITKKGCDALLLDNVRVTLILCDNERIRMINSEYRGKDRPTDVISFAYRDEPFPTPAGETEQLGDVYISLEKAMTQSKEYNTTFLEEMSRLIVHSLCHLVGYDHERSSQDEAIMRDKENEILSKVTLVKRKPSVSKNEPVKKIPAKRK